MFDQVVSRLSTALLVLVTALGLVFAVPGQPQASAANCGPNNGNLCKTDRDCVDLLFYEACTTDYSYYSQ